VPSKGKRRYVITGASGLIGTNLGLRLLDEGHEVHGVDWAPNPWTDRLPVEVRDLRQGAPDWGPADAVVHLAARAKVHESVEQPRNALDNYSITFNVLERCRQHGSPVVFGSSRETYGEQAVFPVPEDAARIKGAASPYAAAKLGEEALIQAYGRCYGVPFIVFRFSNVYGRYDNFKSTTRFIPLVFRLITLGETVTIFGEDKQYDFTYIDDAVDGVARGLAYLAGEEGRSARHTINLGTGTGTTLLRAAEIAGEVIGRAPKIVVGAMRVGEIPRYVADLSQARRLLGYEAKYGPTEGIAEYYRWWSTQPSEVTGLPG
jgi:nucleoside-diphosphate-sugar epimerase